MNILDEAGVEFFKKDLLESTDKQLRLFEKQTLGNSLSRNIHTQEEYGRIKLYADRSKITIYFNLCDKTKGIFLTNNNNHGLLGQIIKNIISASLSWKEQEGLRYGITESTHPELVWEDDNYPKVKITEQGKITKKIEIL